MPRAIETYKKYLRLKPADADARVDMGICYYESGDSPTALKEMQTALNVRPETSNGAVQPWYRDP